MNINSHTAPDGSKQSPSRETEADGMLVGWEQVLEKVGDGREGRAELMEIDENLARAELSPAEEALHIKRRKEIWEQVQAEKEPVGGGISSIQRQEKDGRKKGEQHQKKFPAELAEVMSKDKAGAPDTIKRETNRKTRQLRCAL